MQSTTDYGQEPSCNFKTQKFMKQNCIFASFDNQNQIVYKLHSSKKYKKLMKLNCPSRAKSAQTSPNQPKPTQISSNLRFCFIEIAHRRILSEGLWMNLIVAQRKKGKIILDMFYEHAKKGSFFGLPCRWQTILFLKVAHTSFATHCHLIY